MISSDDIAKLKDIALKILSPIKKWDSSTTDYPNPIRDGIRSNAGRSLPVYYLVYFLFAELLQFKHGGKWDKVAWTFVIDYQGKPFIIEHRKMGIGVFVQNPEVDEAAAKEITQRINKAVKSIKPFYDHIAEKAVLSSALNVVNNNLNLFERYLYHNKLYKAEYELFELNKDKHTITKGETKDGRYTGSVWEGYKYRQQSLWLAISCIEAFFSWTEHLFVHLAIIQGDISDGAEVTKLIGEEWKVKFNKALSGGDKRAKAFYDELLIIRQQMRNFVAHGAFGKDGNAFKFHSEKGAVPVIINRDRLKNRFSLSGTLQFDEKAVIDLIEAFIAFLWKKLEPAMHYTQESNLPTILTYAENGTYAAARTDIQKMKEFVYYLEMGFDNAANMDW